ncbi:MAG: twin-arginine translocase TatA/TatE family subunit [Pseudomonadales bacterium]
MFGLSIWELLIILAIVLLLFGPKRLKNIGADLGNAIKGFRSAVAEEDKPEPQPDPKVIEGEVAANENARAKHNSDTGV